MGGIDVTMAIWGRIGLFVGGLVWLGVVMVSHSDCLGFLGVVILAFAFIALEDWNNGRGIERGRNERVNPVAESDNRHLGDLDAAEIDSTDAR